MVATEATDCYGIIKDDFFALFETKPLVFREMQRIAMENFFWESPGGFVQKDNDADAIPVFQLPEVNFRLASFSLTCPRYSVRKVPPVWALVNKHMCFAACFISVHRRLR